MCAADAPWLLPALTLFTDQQIPAEWTLFFRDLSSSTSALALLSKPTESVLLLKSLLSEVITADKLSCLKTCIPTLYKILRLDIHHNIICLKPIIEQIIKKAEILLSAKSHELPAANASSSIALLPNLPVLNERGVYSLDRVNKPVCTKNAPKFRSLTPGIFTLNCVHGSYSLAAHPPQAEVHL